MTVVRYIERNALRQPGGSRRGLGLVEPGKVPANMEIWPKLLSDEHIRRGNWCEFLNSGSRYAGRGQRTRRAMISRQVSLQSGVASTLDRLQSPP